MAGKSLIPLTAEELSTLVQTAISAVLPQTAKQLAAKATASRNVTEAEMVLLLDDHVQAGRLFLIPTEKRTGKPQYWGQDLHAVIRADVLSSVSASDRPLTQTDITKQMSLPWKLKPQQIADELSALISSRQLILFPATTAKGKPRYWDRDPAELLLPAIQQAADSLTEPATAKDFLKQIKSPVPMTVVEMVPLLEACVSEGSLHRFAPTTAKGQPRYWSQNPAVWGRLLIRRTIEKKGPQQEPALRKAVPFLSDDEFHHTLTSLKKNAELFQHPPLGQVKKATLSLQAPRPEPYLQSVGEQLQAAVKSLKAAHVPDEQLRRALVQILESTGISFGQMTSSPHATAPVSVDIEKLIQQIEPGAARGALVGIRDLRRATKLNKPEFDALLLSLSRQGRLSLHRHDYPASLTADERTDLVVDPQGTYYVGVALRQNREFDHGDTEKAKNHFS